MSECVCVRVLLLAELPSCPVKIKKMDRSLSYSPTFTLRPTWSTFRVQTRRLALRQESSLHPSPHEWRQYLVLERTGGVLGCQRLGPCYCTGAQRGTSLD